MLQGPLQVVDHRQPRSGCSDTFLLSRPDQVLRASLAEVVQLGCGTPPVVFELGNSFFGFLERVGLRLATVALRSLLLWLGTNAGSPDSPPLSATVRDVSWSPPLDFFAPWQS